MPIYVADESVGRASPAVEAAIYFCVREAIQNAAKHAGAGVTVTVTLARRVDAIEFTVSDDGVGLAREAGPEGSGITGMRDRIEAAGGVLEIVSAAGRGTRVCGTVPSHHDYVPECREGAVRGRAASQPPPGSRRLDERFV